MTNHAQGAQTQCDPAKPGYSVKAGEPLANARRALAATIGCFVIALLAFNLSRDGSGIADSESPLFAVGLLGLVLSLVMAITGFAAGSYRGGGTEHIEKIGRGDYFWAKRLTEKELEAVRQAKRDAWERLARVSATVTLIVLAFALVFSLLSRSDDVTATQALLRVLIGIGILAATTLVMGALMVWVFNPNGYLTGEHKHVAITEEGLLVEPVYLTWLEPGQFLTSIDITKELEQQGASLSVQFKVRRAQGGIASGYEFCLPLSSADLPPVQSAVEKIRHKTGIGAQ